MSQKFALRRDLEFISQQFAILILRKRADIFMVQAFSIPRVHVFTLFRLIQGIYIYIFLFPE